MIFLPHKSNDIQHLTQEDFMRSKNRCCHLIGPCWDYKRIGPGPFSQLISCFPHQTRESQTYLPLTKVDFLTTRQYLYRMRQSWKNDCGKARKTYLPLTKAFIFLSQSHVQDIICGWRDKSNPWKELKIRNSRQCPLDLKGDSIWIHCWQIYMILGKWACLLGDAQILCKYLAYLP